MDISTHSALTVGSKHVLVVKMREWTPEKSVADRWGKCWLAEPMERLTRGLPFGPETIAPQGSGLQHIALKDAQDVHQVRMAQA